MSPKYRVIQRLDTGLGVDYFYIERQDYPNSSWIAITQPYSRFRTLEAAQEEIKFIKATSKYFYDKETNEISYSCFDDWFNESLGFSYRSEWIDGDVVSSNPDSLKYWLNEAFNIGRKLGQSEQQ